MLFELSVGYFVMHAVAICCRIHFSLYICRSKLLILSIMQEVPIVHYWHKIIDKGNSIIILYPCIDVPSQAVEMMQSSKGQNQKVHSRWWQTAICSIFMIIMCYNDIIAAFPCPATFHDYTAWASEG